MIDGWIAYQHVEPELARPVLARGVLGRDEQLSANASLSPRRCYHEIHEESEIARRAVGAGERHARQRRNSP